LDQGIGPNGDDGSKEKLSTMPQKKVWLGSAVGETKGHVLEKEKENSLKNVLLRSSRRSRTEVAEQRWEKKNTTSVNFSMEVRFFGKW